MAEFTFIQSTSDTRGKLLGELRKLIKTEEMCPNCGGFHPRYDTRFCWVTSKEKAMRRSRPFFATDWGHSQVTAVSQYWTSSSLASGASLSVQSPRRAARITGIVSLIRTPMQSNGKWADKWLNHTSEPTSALSALVSALAERTKNTV